MKVRDLLREGTDKLNKAGIDNAAYDARQLLMRAYGKTSAELLADLDRPLCAGAAGGQEPQNITQCPGDCGARINYDDFILRRAKHIPLQHILGTASFMGLEFRVNSDVLVPRQDTETLVETVLEREKEGGRQRCEERLHVSGKPGQSVRDVEGCGPDRGMNDDESSKTEPGLRVLDLCTGSGCIAIALKRLGGYAHVTASDFSEAALTVARDNARENDADVEFILSDMFESINGSYDVIVSNPPYIASKLIDSLEPEVRDHDPKAALDGGEDGLSFYRIIAKEAKSRLTCGQEDEARQDDFLCEKACRSEDRYKAGGRLYLEIGYDQAEEVTKLLRDNGYADIEVIKDLSGNNRVVACRIVVRSQKELLTSTSSDENYPGSSRRGD